MSGNDALGKAPTFEEQAAKFAGFSVKDGEVDSGRPTAEEEAAALANRSSHAENVARGATKEEKTPAKVELTSAEADAAIAAAEEANNGEALTEEESDAAVAAALAEKTAKSGNSAPKDKNSPAARIAQSRRLQGNAERRAAALEIENAALRAAALKGGNKEAPLTTDTKGERPVTPGKPDPSDAKKYEYGELDAKYLSDLTRWTVKDANAELAWETKNTSGNVADEAAATAFKERVATFAEAGAEEFGEDFQSVMDSMDLPKDDPDFWPLSAELGELLLESEVGPAIAKELASDPKEARRVNKMSPLRQATWFGVKEAAILAGSGANGAENDEGGAAAARQPGIKKSAAKESKAPLPLASARKLNGAGGNRTPNEATADFSAFEAMATARKN